MITRRDVFQGAATLFACARANALIRVHPLRPAPQLFVFPARDRDCVVIAVSAPRAMTGAGTVHESQTRVRIHASRHAWTVPVAAHGESVASASASGTRQAAPARDGGKPRCDFVAIEVDHRGLRPGECLSVWAELLHPHRPRTRIGSPFMANLVGRFPSLAALYHETSPDLDQTLLPGLVADLVAETARGRVADARAHGERLAARLLPDVLIYQPGRPVGFTFAAQNGRRPDDEVEAVVAAILSGSAMRAERRDRFDMRAS